MDSLSGLIAFVRSVEMNSFVAASKQLGVSASAISKSITRLENSLGVRLFNRSTRRLSLTEEGVLYFERCQRVLDELEEAKFELSHLLEKPSGKLKVSVPVIGYRMLMPILPEFIARYPEIKLDLDFNDNIVDIVAEGIDVAIRSGELSNSQFKARLMGTYRFILVGTKDYFANRNIPQTPMELISHTCLRYRFPATGQLQNWDLDVDDIKILNLRIPDTYVFNNVEALISAAITGMGIAYLPSFSVYDALKRGTLVSILNEFTTENGKFSILWPSNRYLLPKLRVFIDFLVEKGLLGEKSI